MTAGEDAVHNILEHHGVKGQKWGIRRKGPVRTSTDHKEVSKLRGKKTSELSNKQLKKLNERLNLETNVKRLNPDKITTGRHKVEAVIATIGVAFTLYEMKNKPATKALMKQGARFIQGQGKGKHFAKEVVKQGKHFVK